MYLTRHLDGEKIYGCENIQVIAEEEMVTRLAVRTKRVFYINITYLRSLAFNVVELNKFKL
jgi:hypothetical protein